MKNLRNTLIWLAVVAFMLPVAASALNQLLPTILAFATIVGVFAVILDRRR